MPPDEKIIVVHPECPACKKVHELYEPRLQAGEFIEVELTSDHGQEVAKKFRDDTGKEIDAVPFCLKPGTPIATMRGAIPVEDVAPGDMVLSDGGYSNVERVIRRRHVGDLYRIRAEGIPEFYLTDEHPVMTEDGWTEASRIDWGDSVLGPVTSVEPIHHKVGPFSLTADFGYIVGMYAAEGSAHTHPNGQRRRHTRFTLGAHETDIQRELEECLSVHGNPTVSHPRAGSVVISISNDALTRFLATHVGTSSLTKRLSSEIMYGPKTFRESMLAAWSIGDGHIDHRTGRQTVDSASLALVQSFRMVAESTGLKCGHYRRRKPGVTRQGWNTAGLWSLWYDDEQSAQKSHDRVVHPNVRRNMDTVPNDGFVYNMETAAHSFSVHGVLTHNCVVKEDGKLRECKDEEY